MGLILRACFDGWVIALGKPVYIILRWLINLVAAVLVVAPIARLLAKDLEHSIHGDELVAGSLDPFYPWQLYERFSGQLDLLRDTRLILYLGFAVVAVYLSGGILSGLQCDERRSIRGFFAACGKRFPALITVALVSLAMFWVALVVPLTLSYPLPSLVDSDAGYYYAWLVFGVLSILLASWVARFYETWRLLVTEPNRPIRLFANFRRALVFNVRRHFGTFPIWVFFTGIHVALFPIYAWLVPKLGFDTSNGLIIELLAGQAFILARITTDLAFSGGMLSYLRGHEVLPTPARPLVVEPEPVDPPKLLEPPSDPADDTVPEQATDLRAAEIGADDEYGENRFFRDP